MSSVVFGRARVSEELECGFIPSEIIDQLQSDDSSQHIEASQALLSIAQKTPINNVDFKSFLIFSAQFFLDDNFSVINCFNEIVEVFLPQVGQNAIDVLEEFLTMIITPLSDDRRAVRILVVNLMLLYVDTTRSLDLLRAVLPLFPDQPTLAKVEMFEFATQAIQRFKPTNLLYPIFTETITEAMSLNNVLSIHNASSRFLNQICSIKPDFVNTLPDSARSLISDEDQQKLKRAATVRPPAPPSLPLISKTPVPRPINPRGRNLIVRPSATKASSSGMAPRNSNQQRSRQVQLPSNPLPPPTSSVTSSSPSFQVRPPSSDSSSQDPLDDLRERYKCQSQPGIHPPNEPHTKSGGNNSHSSQSPHAPRSLRRSQDRFNLSGQIRKESTEIDSIVNRLQDNDWETQNECIISLIEMVQTQPKFISSNLRTIVFALMSSVSSTRSALSETALTCLRDISSEFGEDMTPFFESILGQLLSILASNKPAVARLAADCISAILVNIDRDAALQFLGKDLTNKSPLIREHLSLCIDALCGDCKDPCQLIDTIGTLLLDEDENTRDHAQAAIAQLKQNFPNLKEVEALKKMNQVKREAVIKAIDNSRSIQFY